jgi:hypothetical protein
LFSKEVKTTINKLKKIMIELLRKIKIMKLTPDEVIIKHHFEIMNERAILR